MPKATFFRLPEAKRARLVQAAYREFSRAPFADASIANIVKDAEIPRGSFYQYFEDKADVFFFLLDQFADTTATALQEQLAAFKGDFFAAVAVVFDQVIAELVAGEHAHFYQNVFMYMDLHAIHKLNPGVGQKPKRAQAVTQYLLTHVDRSKLRVTSDDDVRLLVRQTMGMFMQAVGYYYNRLAEQTPIPVTTLQARLAQLLDWLQHGVNQA